MGIVTWLFGDGVKEGVVENIELTFGGAGNQVMTISGTRYATWIDHKKWPKVGQTVRHKPYTEKWSGRDLLATDILDAPDIP